MNPNYVPLRFIEIKYMCERYPFVILKNKDGFTTLMKSKVILKNSNYINSDLDTVWTEIIGIDWLDYLLIKLRVFHADKL